MAGTTLSILTSVAPLSVVLSLFSKRKEGKKRAQRRSGLKGLQRLLISAYREDSLDTTLKKYGKVWN